MRPVRSTPSEVTYRILGLEGQASGSLVEESRVEAEGSPYLALPSSPAYPCLSQVAISCGMYLWAGTGGQRTHILTLA